jgi:hypothetical protein
VRDRLLLSGIRLITGIAISNRSFCEEWDYEKKEESERRCEVADAERLINKVICLDN